MICTFYSPKKGLREIQDIILEILPDSKCLLQQDDEFKIFYVENKKGFFSSKDIFKVVYRENTEKEDEENALSDNLDGLYRFVNQIPAQNDVLKKQFLLKIRAIESEFSIIQEKGNTKLLPEIAKKLGAHYNTFVFAQPNTFLSKAREQHFLHSDLKLLFDQEGNSEIENLGPEMVKLQNETEAKYKQMLMDTLSEDQIERKFKNEALLNKLQVKVNSKLPAVESEKETVLRTPETIAQRLAVMAFINAFANKAIDSEKTTELLKGHNLWEYVSPNEKELIENPTDEALNNETWRCEGIWVLLWALNIVDELGNATDMCDLSGLTEDNYPLKDPAGFIEKYSISRTKAEILDAADLYYRYEWTAVDARLKGIHPTGINSSIVYERHYALNWLIQYQNQEWDDVSCDS